MKLMKILTLSLMLALALSLVACDKSADIKTRFEEEGYTVSSLPGNNSKVRAIFTLAGLTEEEIDELEDYEIIFCEKSIYSALYIKFPSSGELRDELTEDGDATAYNEAVEEGRVNGNCLLIYSIGDGDVIFRSGK